MIVAERPHKVVDWRHMELVDRDRDFDAAFPDGRLVADPKPGPVYDMRSMALHARKIGRPLTEDEMERFISRPGEEY